MELPPPDDAPPLFKPRDRVVLNRREAFPPKASGEPGYPLPVERGSRSSIDVLRHTQIHGIPQGHLSERERSAHRMLWQREDKARADYYASLGRSFRFGDTDVDPAVVAKRNAHTDLMQAVDSILPRDRSARMRPRARPSRGSPLRGAPESRPFEIPRHDTWDFSEYSPNVALARAIQEKDEKAMNRAANINSIMVDMQDLDSRRDRAERLRERLRALYGDSDDDTQEGKLLEDDSALSGAKRGRGLCGGDMPDLSQGINLRKSARQNLQGQTPQQSDPAMGNPAMGNPTGVTANEYHKAAKASYSQDPSTSAALEGWTLAKQTPTLKFYTRGNECLVGVRGSKDFRDWQANAHIPFKALEKSSRFKEDEQEVRAFRAQHPELTSFHGAGHSLGGAVIDLLLDKGLLDQARSYNPALQAQHATNDARHQRVYSESDPLYIGLAKPLLPDGAAAGTVPNQAPDDVSNSAQSIEVRKAKFAASNILGNHSLDQFEGGRLSRRQRHALLHSFASASRGSPLRGSPLRGSPLRGAST